MVSKSSWQALAKAAAVHNAIVLTAAHVVGAMAVIVAAVSGISAVLATSGATVHHNKEPTIHTSAIALLTAFLIFHNLLFFLGRDSLAHSFKDG
ncbi:hypothetical protein J6V86_00865 [bacterium]|nr:hypothetical protein [bacterium]